MFCRDRKSDTSACFLWFRPNPAAMGTHKTLTDREPQTGAACQARQAIIHAIKAFEDMLSFLLGYPGSIIDDTEEEVIPLPAYFHSDRRILSTIFD